jgi:hypothetical protein
VVEDATPATATDAATGDVVGSGGKPRYFASIYPGREDPIPDRLGELVVRLEEYIGKPTWLLIQRPRSGPFAILNHELRVGFFHQRDQLRACPDGVALVVDSAGGDAREAFKLATMLRRHCSSFTAVVPRYAKSAATLLVLGADELHMGADAELGPLDAQLLDPDREQIASALDEVQALERLHVAALDMFDSTTQLLVMRTRKKLETLMPMAMRFTSDLMTPLLDKIDTVHYTQQSRVLKVAEDYALRLLAPRYSEEEAEDIAHRLVNNYTEHGFVIDSDEVSEFMELAETTDELQATINELEEFLMDETSLVAVGRVEKGDEHADDDAATA